ncbi:ANTAR domain-containing protein [Kribbella pratensis]|jgi:hypothetical protein|uniref:ANTAR domain-containing protein n=1 Tax=Kribbella pratensis TaxID=2512112 RepID=A0A4R8CF61_9ACTN|nr:ANTAR domain-containing protein [Kribbella pratensis]TDW74929.1 hypothetical protein EV653_0031 [Kribbella pratensis]
MDAEDDELSEPFGDWTHPALLLGIAEGILMSRYQIPAHVANALLRSCAATVGLSLVQVADWLISTGRLPQPV